MLEGNEDGGEGTIVRATESAEPTERAKSWRGYWRRVPFLVRIALVLSVTTGAAWWFLLLSDEGTTHTVATGTVIAEVMGTGTLEARTSAVVGAKIGGLIVRMAADEGDRVKAGGPLFELEDSDTKQQVRMAESDLAVAKAALDRLRAAERGAEAVHAQAKTAHERTAELTSKNVVSAQDLDRAVEALAIAEADLSIAGAAIIEGQKRLDAAERSLEYQRARLDDTTIEAPFDGLVVRRDRDPGDVVAAGASVFEIASTDEMWITAWVDETELARLAEGQPARVVFRSEPGAEYRGRGRPRRARGRPRDAGARGGGARGAAARALGRRPAGRGLHRAWTAETTLRCSRRDSCSSRDATGVWWRRSAAAGARSTVGLRGREVVEVSERLVARRRRRGPAELLGPLRTAEDRTE